MGVFGKLKELFSARRYIARVMEEMDRKNERLAAMSPDELLNLSDDDLCSAILYRIDKVIAASLGKPSEADPLEAFEILSSHQQTVFALACWESELAGGGLCKFLAGECGVLLPHIPEMLRRVEADAHLSLLSEFADAHGLDLTSPSEFTADNEFDYATQRERLPFPAFDDPYRRLNSLEIYISLYIRANVTEF